MIVRPPSLQKQRTEYYSGDPAFTQRPALTEDMTPEQIEEWKKAVIEHSRLWEVARETADYTALQLDGSHPTAFTLRPLGSELARKLTDMIDSDAIGGREGSAIAFRAAIAEVAGFDPIDPKGNHPTFGRMATIAIVETLDAIDHRIVTELGTIALQRARRISPKP